MLESKMPSKNTIISSGGPPCPRCEQPTQIREHASITAKILAQPFYYSRWFFCTNRKCRATMFTTDEFKVLKEGTNVSTLRRGDDVVMDVVLELSESDHGQAFRQQRTITKHPDGTRTATPWEDY
jgi:hypothetical protein